VLAALRQGPGDNDAMYLQRMRLERAAGFSEWLDARLLRLALARTART
jgi:hypothetical protein